MDANHGDSDGPGCVPDAEAEVRVVGLEVLALLHVVDNLCQALEDVWLELALAQRLEERLEVLCGLELHGRSQFPLLGALDGV